MRTNNIAILAVLLIFVSQPAAADVVWKRITASIEREDIRCIEVDRSDPNRLYLGTANGLFFTVDGGIGWRRVFKKRGASNIVNDINLSADRIAIATDGGLYASKLDRFKWKRLGGNPARSRTFSIKSSNSGTGALYVVSEMGVYKKAWDADSSWEKLLTSGPAEPTNEPADEDVMSLPQVRCIAVTGDDKSLYLGTEDGVYLLGDGHGYFERLTDEGLISKVIYDLALEPYGGRRLCAVTKDGIFYYHGMWEKEDISGCRGKPKSIAFDLDPINSAWVVTDKSLYRSVETVSPEDGIAIESLNILSYFDYEPTITEVQAMAVEYAEVHPDKISSWRTRANLSAFMPRLSLGVDQDEADTYEIYTSSSTQYSYIGPKKRSKSWDLTFTWDLADIIWNSDQTLIDVRSKLMVQLRDDILDEVTSYYFERRRLQTELLSTPPTDSKVKVRKELRLQELTANIDGMTGGYFTSELESRGQ